MTFPGGASAPAVRVTISRGHEFSFIRALGVNEKAVGAVAKGILVSFGGGDGIVPWAIEDQVLTSVPFGQQIIIKYDANNPENGNFGPIRVDGSDSTTYQDAVSYGSDSKICSVGTDGCLTTTCPGTYQRPARRASPSATALNAVPSPAT